jgi:hypothetical protein
MGCQRGDRAVSEYVVTVLRSVSGQDSEQNFVSVVEIARGAVSVGGRDCN